MKTLSNLECTQVSGSGGVWGSSEPFFSNPIQGIPDGMLVGCIFGFYLGQDFVLNTFGTDYQRSANIIAIPLGIVGAVIGAPVGFGLGLYGWAFK